MGTYTRHTPNPMLEQLRKLMSQPPSTANNMGSGGGGGYLAPYYGPGGGYMVAQNQPGVSDFGQDAGGRWTTTNIRAGGTPIYPAEHNKHAQNDNMSESLTGKQTVEAFWHLLQQKYPQLTKGIKMTDTKSLSPGGTTAGEGTPGHFWIDPTIADQRSNGGPFGRFVVAKELGQAVLDRMIGSDSRGDEMMRLWGAPIHHGSPEDLRSYGLPDNPSVGRGDFKNLAKQPNAINAGGFASYPADAYGVQFAAGMGQPSPYSDKPGVLLQGPKLAYAQSRGLVPTDYTHPQQSMDVSRAEKPRMNALMQRLLAVQAVAHAQGAAQQNAASQAMHGIKSARYS